MASTNEEIINQAADALARGDMRAFLSLASDDVTFHVPGRSELSGDHTGKDAVHRVFERETELCGGKRPEVEVHDSIASADHGVILHKARFQRGERSLEDNSVLVAQLENGQITAMWLHPEDLYANDEFWS